ncbi:MAG: hypothetical protein WCV56_01820 [Candidatus Omnitrophota bacterium]
MLYGTLRELPFFGMGLIVVGLAVILSISGLLLVRRFVSDHHLKHHNDIAGAIFQTLGVSYAVLLAFMVVVAWQNFERAGLSVEKEANYIASLIKKSYAFEEGFGGRIRAASQKYADIVIADWELLAEGKESPEAKEALRKLSSLFAGYTPQNTKEEIFFSESVKKIGLLGETMRARIFESRQNIPLLLWTVLIFGGITTISFTFFFGSANLSSLMVMTSLLAILISLILYTILCLDSPFTGDIRIEPDAFRHMLSY